SRKDMDLAQYRSWMQGRIAHINHALRGLPVERIRYHTCYGVNFGPRVSDLQLDDVLDLLFTINAGFYSFEAANPRHDHEWRVLARIRLPAGKRLIPGAVTHSNVTIEHPEGVADRMERWIKAAGASPAHERPYRKYKKLAIDCSRFLTPSDYAHLRSRRSRARARSADVTAHNLELAIALSVKRYA